MGGIYKLVEQEHNGKVIPKMKFSEDKLTYPCKKQVYRTLDKTGNFVNDVIGLEDENLQGTPLLIPVIKDGKTCYNIPTIHEIQITSTHDLAHLAERFKRLKEAEIYPVTKSQGLEAKRHETENIIKDVNVSKRNVFTNKASAY